MEKLPNNQVVVSVMEKLGLRDPAFVEKDFYVTQVLHAMNELKNDHFDLVFIGGTCLTKAHKVVQRMSEDSDFKLVPRDANSLNSRAAREKLSHVREEIIGCIRQHTGLYPKEGQLNKGNNNRFTQIFLDYDPIYPIHSILRPQIKIELTAQAMLLPPERLEVSSLIHQLLPSHNTTSQTMLCTSICETAAEKWAALGRRIADADRENNIDQTLIRHLYDLCCIEKKGISSDFERLIPDVVLRDRERFKGKSPHFYNAPLEELKTGFENLVKKSHWKSSYQEFIQNMVFQNDPPTYQQALETLDKLHHRAMNGVQSNIHFQNTIKSPLTVETNNELFESCLNKYQTLRKIAEKKQELSSVASLHHFADELSSNAELMTYTKKMHPTAAKNIQLLSQEKQQKILAIKGKTTPEQETLFKETLQQYRQLRKHFEEKSTAHNHDTLTAFANNIAHNKPLMEYAHYLHPKTTQNIKILSGIHIDNIQQQRIMKQQNHDLER